MPFYSRDVYVVEIQSLKSLKSRQRFPSSPDTRAVQRMSMLWREGWRAFNQSRIPCSSTSLHSPIDRQPAWFARNHSMQRFEPLIWFHTTRSRSKNDARTPRPPNPSFPIPLWQSAGVLAAVSIGARSDDTGGERVKWMREKDREWGGTLIIGDWWRATMKYFHP